MRASVFLGSRPVGELATGAVENGFDFADDSAGTAAGTYYLVGKADWNTAVAESAETNNERASVPVKVGADLVVTAVTASSTVMVGGPVTVTDTTANQSATPAPVDDGALPVARLCLQPDGRCVPRSRVVPSLQPTAQQSTASTPLTIPPGTSPGTYYVLAVCGLGCVGRREY
jgi:hypothetical protein